jgi:hypothetical protein
MFWHATPFVFSQAHAGTDYVTTHRVLTFDRMCRDAMTKIGVPILDATMITQSFWESAYDGLHYLRGNSDNWNGHTSQMVFHVLLNGIFPTCGAEDEDEDVAASGSASEADEPLGDPAASSVVDAASSPVEAASSPVDVPSSPSTSSVTPPVASGDAVAPATSPHTATTKAPGSLWAPTAIVVPPSLPVCAACAPPELPFALPTVATGPQELTVGAVRYSISVPSFEDCVPGAVVFTPSDTSLLAKTADPNALGFSVVLVMWTHANRDGKPCAAGDGSCYRMVRRQSLLMDRGRTNLFVTITADPSVRHYQIIVQVCVRVSGSCSPRSC